MSIVEKLDYDEFTLLEVISHPVLFIEFYQNEDTKEEFSLTEYQREFVCDFNHYVSMTCGRAVGKTLSLVGIILWIMINQVYDNDYIVYTVPNKVHLDPVFNGLIIQLRANPFLRNFIDAKKGINASTFTIRLNNGSTLDCRIAGQSGTGANVIGLHTPFIILDEAGYYPWGTWIELLPTLNTWTKGYRMYVSGVPTGMRENNVLYYADQVDHKFSKHRVSSLENPRYSKEDDERNANQYGGRDSDDYLHLVMGQHASPTYSVFDRRQMAIDSYPVYKMFLNGNELQSDLGQYINRLILLPALPEEAKYCIFGIDLGFTDPTAIVCLYQLKSGQFKFAFRVTLHKVQYPVQEKLIDFLDTRYRPALLGIDEGNAGKSTIHHLLDDNEYIHKNYPKRLYPVNFSSSISVGMTSDNQEILEKVKPLAVSILQQYTQDHRIIYASTDFDMVSELERMTYTKTVTGNIVYKTSTSRGGQDGEDHFTSALLCAFLAYHQTNEAMLVSRQKKLFKSRWLTYDK